MTAKPEPLPVARPLLLVVSAPSGAGKSTLCRRLLADFPDQIVFSVSCTTRPPRPGEVDGKDYRFLSEEEFERLIREGAFLEYARVHGNLYGTPADSVLAALREGRHVLLDIDVQGAEQIRASVARRPPDDPLRRGFLDIFILPPSIEELERRLRGRGTDSEEVIRRRLENAAGEMKMADRYRYRIVNDDLDEAYARLVGIIRKEAARPEPDAETKREGKT